MTGQRAGRRRRRRAPAGFRVGAPFRWAVLLATAVYFLVPLAASARYAVQGNGGTFSLGALTLMAHDGALWSGLLVSLAIAAGASAISLALLIPTAIWVNLRMPSFGRVIEGLTLMPLVVPTVVLVLGIINAFKDLPGFFFGTPLLLAVEYVVLALPYSYRAVDSGVRALDLRTLVDAGRSLGATWPQLLRLVLLPNLREAILAASFLTVAYSLGEFVVANLLTFNTFPTRLYEVGTEYADEAVAVSVLALTLTWAVLLSVSVLGGRGASREARRSQRAAMTAREARRLGSEPFGRPAAEPGEPA